MEISWVSHACFKIKTESGKVIYLDPYEIPADEEKADVIVASHGHYDHMDGGSIKNVWKDSTVLLGPKSMAGKLKGLKGEGMELGNTRTIDDVTVELVPAYTIKKGTHPKSSEWAGTIIEAENKRIYHAGDTERIPEMKDLSDKDITVALLPCGGTYTMDFEESCAAALDIQPEIVVPMHNWDKDLEGYKNLLQEKDPNIRVEILKKRNLKV